MGITWLEIGWAILLGMMVLFLLPRAKIMLKETPAGSSKDWLIFAIIMLVIAGFILLLIRLL